MVVEQFDVKEFLAPAARTTNGQSASLDLGDFDDLIVYLNITAIGGTSPTLDVKLQSSDDGTDWFDLPNGAFAQKTATGKAVLQYSSNFGRYVRVDYIIAGTTPSFTFEVDVVPKN